MSQIIRINEVFPNPESGSEWIEFSINEESAESLSLTNYTIFDSYHQIYKFTSEQFNDQLLVADVSGLNNDQDSIILKDTYGNILDSFSYISTQKGLSWSREVNTSNFVISEASMGQINPSATPTINTTPVPSVTLAPSTVVTASATPTTTQNANALPTGQPQMSSAPQKTFTYDLSKVKLTTEEKIVINKTSRLVILGKNQSQTEIINAIIGSLMIVLSSLYLIYVKRKSKQN